MLKKTDEVPRIYIRLGMMIYIEVSFPITNHIMLWAPEVDTNEVIGQRPFTPSTMSVKTTPKAIHLFSGFFLPLQSYIFRDTNENI